MRLAADTTLLPGLVHVGDRSFSRAELVALTSPRRVRTAISRNEVVAVLPGRYASRAHHLAFTVRAHAAAAACRGVITGASALFVAGVLDRPPVSIDVLLPNGGHAPASSWLVARRATALPPALDWRSIPVAVPAHAVVEVWRRGRDDSRIGTVLAALQRRATTPDLVREALATSPRTPDKAGLLRILAGFEAGAHSFLEYEGLTRTFRGRDFARFIRQHAVLARGSRYDLDMYDPATLTAVELDGSRYHLPGEQRERDIRRDADIATLGILTVRLSYRDVMERPGWCRDTVLAVLRTRDRQHSA